MIIKKVEKKSINRIPQNIFEYLKNHFDGALISDIIKIKDHQKHFFYNININYEGILYRLKFNTDGMMIYGESEPLLELDESEYEIINL